MNQGPFGQDSRPALVGAKFAEAHGMGAAYHDAVFSAYWEHAQPIEEPAVLAAIATAIGLDADAFLAAFSDPALVALVDADIATAAAYQLSGVPALVFASRYLVSGAQTSDVLREVVDKIIAEQG
jgi:predicted DsbA family dithiol-disulfide isomerase